MSPNPAYLPLSRRDLLKLGSAAAALAPWASAVPAWAQAPKRGGVLTIRGWDPPHFDPASDRLVQDPHRVLVHAQPSREAQGRARASSPAPSPSRATSPSRGRSPTRPPTSSSCAEGVRWHNKPPVNGRELDRRGRRLHARALPDRQGQRQRLHAGRPGQGRGARQVHRQVHPEGAVRWFLDMLANPMAVCIVAKECVEKFGDLKKPEATVGTGPWMLDSYRPNVGITLVRNPTYFVPGLPEHRPHRDPGGRGQCLAHGRVPRRQVRPRLGVSRAPSTAWTGCRSRTSLKQRRPGLQTMSSRRT